MKKIVIIALILLSVSFVNAQQEFMITHYMFNALAINPAYAGAHRNISTSFVHRTQWFGVTGAPTTQMASVHGTITGKPISLGAVLYRDGLGFTNEYGAYLSTAYRIRLNKTLRLSFGLQGNIQNFAANYDVANDPTIYSQRNKNAALVGYSDFNWNFGTGLMLHNDRFFLGVSVPQILNVKLNTVSTTANDVPPRLLRHFYLYTGYAFSLSDNLVLKPNVLIKAVQNSPTQIDLNANLLIKKFIWLGVSYRSLDSMDALVGIQITPQLLFSYATDFTFTKIKAQSHEFMLNYVFNLPTSKILTPRYF